MPYAFGLTLCARKNTMTLVMFDVEILGMTVNVPAQICGLIGLVIIVAAYQMNKRKLVIWQLAGYVFCLAEALFVLGWIGVVVTAGAMVRNVFMIYYRYRHDSEVPQWVTTAMVALIWAGCIPFYITGIAGAWFDYFPPVLLTVSTVCAVNKNFYVLKAGAFVHESGYIVYHLSVGAYLGIVRQIVLSAGVVISVVRMILADKKSKKACEINNAAACAIASKDSENTGT